MITDITRRLANKLLLYKLRQYKLADADFMDKILQGNEGDTGKLFVEKLIINDPTISLNIRIISNAELILKKSRWFSQKAVYVVVDNNLIYLDLLDYREQFINLHGWSIVNPQILI